MKTLFEWQLLLGKNVNGVIQGPWVHQMAWVWERGAREFKKVPATIARLLESGELEGVSAAIGEPRSLLDPEPSPPGTVFCLAWNDGARWHYEIPYCDVQDEQVLHQSKNPVLMAIRREDLRRKNEKEKRLELVRSVEIGRYADLPSKEHLRFLLAYMGLNLARDEAKKGNLEDAIAQAFEAGMVFGQRDALAQVDAELQRLAELNKATEWTIVAYDALCRHGKDLTPRQLLAKMGGVDERGKMVAGDWSFPSGQRIDFTTFQNAHKQAKKRIDAVKQKDAHPGNK